MPDSASLPLARGDLRDLEQVAVTVLEDGPDFGASATGGGEEVGATSVEEVEGRPAVVDAEDDLGADSAGVVRFGQGDRRLIGGWVRRLRPEAAKCPGV